MGWLKVILSTCGESVVESTGPFYLHKVTTELLFACEAVPTLSMFVTRSSPKLLIKTGNWICFNLQTKKVFRSNHKWFHHLRLGSMSKQQRSPIFSIKATDYFFLYIIQYRSCLKTVSSTDFAKKEMTHIFVASAAGERTTDKTEFSLFAGKRKRKTVPH